MCWASRLKVEQITEIAGFYHIIPEDSIRPPLPESPETPRVASHPPGKPLLHLSLIALPTRSGTSEPGVNGTGNSRGSQRFSLPVGLKLNQHWLFSLEMMLRFMASVLDRHQIWSVSAAQIIHSQKKGLSRISEAPEAPELGVYERIRAFPLPACTRGKEVTITRKNRAALAVSS